MWKKCLLFIHCLLTSLVGMSQSTYDVYVFIGESCPICNFMGKPLADLARKYESEVRFHAVFPARNSNYKSAQLFKEKYGMMTYETLLDKNLTLTRQLGASVTPEVVVTNEAGEVKYRGRINSANLADRKMKHSTIKHDLDEALALLLAEKDVPQPWPTPVGCFIMMYAPN